MKQHITYRQWQELTDQQQVEFIQGCVTKLGVPAWESVTIGVMIEFLHANWDRDFAITGSNIYWEDLVRTPTGMDWLEPRAIKSQELCDALWEVIKEVLEHE
jgi:hypothetical protein